MGASSSCWNDFSNCSNCDMFDLWTLFKTKQMALEVYKTDREVELNEYYMKFIRKDQIIPKHVVTAFKNTANVVRMKNPIYNEKLN